MNISFYSAATGAQQQQRRLDVHGNNIANVNTYGFRAERPTFSALMFGAVTGIDNERLPRGVGSRLEAADTDFRGSAIADTGRHWDYAIKGHGFFALLDPATGEYTYTRDGSFTKAELQVPAEEEQNKEELTGDEDEEAGTGALETRWYLSDGLGRFVIGRDGRAIEITDEDAELPVGVFDFINTNGMQHLSENRFAPIEKNGQVRAGDGVAVSGCLEVSNADLATELVKVIESQRSFSYMLKMVQTSDEIETTVNSLRG